MIQILREDSNGSLVVDKPLTRKLVRHINRDRTVIQKKSQLRRKRINNARSETE